MAIFFAAREDEVGGREVVAAAVSYIQIPIRSSDVIFVQEPEEFGSAINAAGRAFELEVRADGRFVEIQMEIFDLAETVGGAEFFIAEIGMKAEGVEDGFEGCRGLERDFELLAFLVPRGGRK